MPSEVQHTKEIVESISEISRKIPGEYIEYCEWLDKLSDHIKDGKVDPKIVLKVHKENMKKADRCYSLHNKLIDFIIKNNL